MSEEEETGLTEGTTPAETANVVGGIGVGAGGGCCMVVLGVLLSATGIGMIIGIPMILAGIAVPLVCAVEGAKARKGPCPYCRTEVINNVATAKGITCTACKQRIIIRDGQFFKIGD